MARKKLLHNNDIKKSRKMKQKPQVEQQQDPSAKLFELMQERVVSGLLCCEPGRELEVLHTSLHTDYQTLW